MAIAAEARRFGGVPADRAGAALERLDLGDQLGEELATVPLGIVGNGAPVTEIGEQRELLDHLQRATGVELQSFGEVLLLGLVGFGQCLGKIGDDPERIAQVVDELREEDRVLIVLAPVTAGARPHSIRHAQRIRNRRAMRPVPLDGLKGRICGLVRQNSGAPPSQLARMARGRSEIPTLGDRVRDGGRRSVGACWPAPGA
jgi:hypothetical protein